jgi:hypothetical protein
MRVVGHDHGYFANVFGTLEPAISRERLDRSQTKFIGMHDDNVRIIMTVFQLPSALLLKPAVDGRFELFGTPIRELGGRFQRRAGQASTNQALELRQNLAKRRRRHRRYSIMNAWAGCLLHRPFDAQLRCARPHCLNAKIDVLIQLHA